MTLSAISIRMCRSTRITANFCCTNFNKIPNSAWPERFSGKKATAQRPTVLRGKTTWLVVARLFRRQCFEEIGGYVPNKAGGIDWIAVTTARMIGWKTRSFREKSFFHYRSLGTAERSQLASAFSYGEKDYYLGNHPLWEICRVRLSRPQETLCARCDRSVFGLSIRILPTDEKTRLEGIDEIPSQRGNVEVACDISIAVQAQENRQFRSKAQLTKLRKDSKTHA